MGLFGLFKRKKKVPASEPPKVEPSRSEEVKVSESTVSASKASNQSPKTGKTSASKKAGVRTSPGA